MGSIWGSTAMIAGQCSEVVGYKAGLALTRKQMHDHLVECPDYDGLFRGKRDVSLRLRSEEIQALLVWLLWRVGYLAKPTFGAVTIDLYHKYKQDPEALALYEAVASLFVEALQEAIEVASAGNNVINPGPFLNDAIARFGPVGGLMACELVESLDHEFRADPFSRLRPVEWSDAVALTELFDSESLNASHGKFLDQRFVDYLAANHEALDSMHWRKFEGLAAEFFVKQGYHVEIGPGRNDDGVDVRVWRPDAEPAKGPPLILVQCKRQKTKIEKVIVKALWADVIAEGATSGMIVTTSRLSPGAANVVTARKYPMEAADRPTLSRWLHQMRSPGTGVFMGE